MHIDFPQKLCLEPLNIVGLTLSSIYIAWLSLLCYYDVVSLLRRGATWRRGCQLPGDSETTIGAEHGMARPICAALLCAISLWQIAKVLAGQIPLYYHSIRQQFIRDFPRSAIRTVRKRKREGGME